VLITDLLDAGPVARHHEPAPGPRGRHPRFVQITLGFPGNRARSPVSGGRRIVV
jgi:hypothetical protein